MRSPETASPSLTIRRSITCECDQHLHFSAEVSQNRSRKTLHSARRGPGAKASAGGGCPPGYAAAIAGAITSAGGAASDASLMQCSYLRTGLAL